MTYNITVEQEFPPGSGTKGGSGYIRSWSGITGTTLQLPSQPNAVGASLGGVLRTMTRYFVYGAAVNGDGTTDNTTPDTQVWAYDSFVTAQTISRSRGRTRDR